MNLAKTVLSHLAVFGIAAGVYFVQGPEYVRHPFDRLPEGGDSILNAWILAWDAHALFEPQLNVWDAPIFYPVKNALAFSETMFGNLWITLPVQYLSGNHVLAFHALVLTSFLLCSYFTFLLVYALTRSFPAGLIAGLIFSFNPYRWSEVLHVQLLPFFWAPLALLFCHRFLETWRTRYFVGQMLALLVQFYASIYLGIILFMTLLVFGTVHILAERQGKDRWVFVTNRRLLWTQLAGWSLLLLALLPLAIPYWQTTHAWNFARSESDNVSFSCELLSFLVPDAAFRSYQGWQQLFQGHVHGSVGLGLVPWGLALTALVLARRFRHQHSEGDIRVLKRFAWTGLVVALFMLGPYVIWLGSRTDVPLPYLMVYHVIPGAKAMRVPARYVFPLLLCLAVLGGFAVARLVEGWRRWRPAFRVASGLAAVALLGMDYAVTDQAGVVLETKDHFPPVYDYLAHGGAGQPILELPVGMYGQFRHLHYQTAHWRPLLGGESGCYPPAIAVLIGRTLRPPSEDMLRFIRLAPVQTLVIHLDQYDNWHQGAWRRADLSRHGFTFAGQHGEALVWERQALPLVASPRLRVVQPLLEHSKGVLRDAWKLEAVVVPAEKERPWRFLDQGTAELEIVLVDPEGKEYRYASSVQVPPYLLAEESATLKLGNFRGGPKQVQRLRLRGPLFQPYEAEVN
jgi:hypothetical protein